MKSPERILLDESVPARLRHEFSSGFIVESVEFRGWKGKQNGDLLKLIAEANDDAVFTSDVAFHRSVKEGTWGVAIFLLCPPPAVRKTPDYASLIPAAEARLLAGVEKKVYVVGDNIEVREITAGAPLEYFTFVPSDFRSD